MIRHLPAIFPIATHLEFVHVLVHGILQKAQDSADGLGEQWGEGSRGFTGGCEEGEEARECLGAVTPIESGLSMGKHTCHSTSSFQAYFDRARNSRKESAPSRM